MLNKYISIGFILLLTLIISYGCSSSKRLLERGNYYQAVLAATSKLKKSPGNGKAQKALKVAYPLAIQFFRNEIHKAEVSHDPWQWSVTVDAYQSLNAMYEAIQSTPKARQIISNPKSFYKEYGQVKEKAAMEQYQAGEKALRHNTRESARDAYYLFQKANMYVPGYRDATSKMVEAKDIATLRVVLELVPVPSRFYKVSADFFYDKVAAYVRNRDTQYAFIAFYTPGEAKRLKMTNPDQILRLQFEDFVVGQMNTVRNTETVTSEDSVKVGEVTLEGGVTKPIYNTVTAKLTTTHVEVISGGLLSMEVIDAYNHNTLYRQEIPGEYIWFDEWGSFNGDERALTKEEIRLCKQKPTTPPSPQRLFIEFTKPIYDQFTSRLISFYRGYA